MDVDRIAEHKAAKGQMHTECIGDCDMVCNFLKLTDEMVKTILELDEGPLRWRQAPLKYLPPEWTEGLWQAIFNNTSRDFEGNPAYELYVRLSCNGQDPQQEASSKYYSASSTTSPVSWSFRTVIFTSRIARLHRHTSGELMQL